MGGAPIVGLIGNELGQQTGQLLATHAWVFIKLTISLRVQLSQLGLFTFALRVLFVFDCFCMLDHVLTRGCEMDWPVELGNVATRSSSSRVADTCSLTSYFCPAFFLKLQPQIIQLGFELKGISLIAVGRVVGVLPILFNYYHCCQFICSPTSSQGN